MTAHVADEFDEHEQDEIRERSSPGGKSSTKLMKRDEIEVIRERSAAYPG